MKHFATVIFFIFSPLARADFYAIGDSQIGLNLGRQLRAQCLNDFKDLKMMSIGSSRAHHFVTEDSKNCLSRVMTITESGDKVRSEKILKRPDEANLKPEERTEKCDRNSFTSYGNEPFKKFQEIVSNPAKPSEGGTVFVFLGDNSITPKSQKNNETQYADVKESVELAKSILKSGRKCVWTLPGLKIRANGKPSSPSPAETVQHNKMIAQALRGLKNDKDVTGECEIIDPADTLTRGTKGPLLKTSTVKNAKTGEASYDPVHYNAESGTALASMICKKLKEKNIVGKSKDGTENSRQEEAQN